MDNRLEEMTLEVLEAEVEKRYKEQTQKILDQSSFEQLNEEVKVKEETEFKTLYNEIFPNEDEDIKLFYPKMKEKNEQRVRDILRSKKGDDRSVKDIMYPSLSGGNK